MTTDDLTVPKNSRNTSMKKSQSSKTLKVYRIRTSCGQYRGVVVAIAHNVGEAVAQANAIAGAAFPECRDNVSARHVTELGDAEPGFAAFAWDGEL